MNLNIRSAPTHGIPHRGKAFERFVDVDQQLSIAGIDILVLETSGGQWWITPEDPADETRMLDIGPFESAEVAWSTLTLLKD